MSNLSSTTPTDLIVIVDFGSQYTQLIACQVRKLGVYSEIIPFHVLTASTQPLQRYGKHLKGLIFSGGPDDASTLHAAQVHASIYNLGVPILGICYGMHVLASDLGGTVEPAKTHEYGKTQVHLTSAGKRSKLFCSNPSSTPKSTVTTWMSHSIEVTALPSNCIILALSENDSIAAFEHSTKPLFGLQFHPEVTHTPLGTHFLRNFIIHSCGCIEHEWRPPVIIDTLVQSVQNTVQDSHVLLGLSGGVDSSVVAALLQKAIGQQLTCIFVDTGLLRYREGDQVMKTFSEYLGVHVIRVNASTRFYKALENVSEPETKRRIIGKLFVDIFEEEARKLSVPIAFLAQGTIYPDVIESTAISQSCSVQSHHKKNIKSHHNVGGLPERLPFQLLEPLRCLFKDEVRRIGGELGLSTQCIHRHPFPGPGLGVRILGPVCAEYVNILQQADHIFMTELHKFGWYNKVSQAFAVFLPIKTVGVVGDERRYAYVISLRAVNTVDFMTASWARLPPELLESVSTRIVNEIVDVARVVYDISGKPPSTIEWE